MAREVETAVTLMVVDGVDVTVVVSGLSCSTQPQTPDTTALAWARKLLNFEAAVLIEDVVELDAALPMVDVCSVVLALDVALLVVATIEDVLLEVVATDDVELFGMTDADVELDTGFIATSTPELVEAVVRADLK